MVKEKKLSQEDMVRLSESLKQKYKSEEQIGAFIEEMKQMNLSLVMSSFVMASVFGISLQESKTRLLSSVGENEKHG